MAWLEKVSDENYRAFFVDLYVRCVNFAAITMYEGLGYSVYRRVREYYSNLGLGYSVRDEEDGFGTSCRRIPVGRQADSEQICGNRFLEILCEDLYDRTDGILSLARTRYHSANPRMLCVCFNCSIYSSTYARSPDTLGGVSCDTIVTAKNESPSMKSIAPFDL